MFALVLSFTVLYSRTMSASFSCKSHSLLSGNVMGLFNCTLFSFYLCIISWLAHTKCVILCINWVVLYANFVSVLGTEILLTEKVSLNA